MKLYLSDITTSLDYDRIKEDLAAYCTAPEAAEKARQLKPLAGWDHIREALQATDEILSLLQAGEAFPKTRFESMAAAARQLQTQGHSLDEEGLDQIRSALLQYEQLYQFLSRHSKRFPILFAPVESISPLPLVRSRIDKVLDARGRVRSQASATLARLREKLQQSRASAARIFERSLRKYQDKGWLADFGESVAENRRVLAVEATHKAKVPGIFHGSSSRGSIVFMEPGESVETNNQVAQLIDEERQEVHRILLSLSRELHPEAPALLAIHRQQVYLDLKRAQAAYAFDESACVPRLTPDQPGVELREAWHPVLRKLNRKKGQPTEPLYLELHQQQRILVISGPNAGGKTIALKTLGLLCLMLQSGLPVPVDPQSRFGIFDHLMADIGDSQSLQDELSTYSSRLKKMRYFLRHSGPGSLLLIDEFGSGSDPDLGSALARVFLKALHQSGTYAILTTHYNGIKALAAELPHTENAAMLFDRESLRPEYRLESGQPGSSYTFEVAGQSGIPDPIIAQAREETQQNIMEVDRLLSQMQNDKLKLEKEREKLRKELQKVHQLRQEQENTIERLEDKLARQSRQNEETDRLLHWGQRFRKLLESWQKQAGKKDKKQIVARFLAMLAQEDEGLKKVQTQREKKKRQKGEKQLARLLKLPLKVGDKVKVLDKGFRGTVRHIQDEKYTVAISDSITTTLTRDKIVPLHPPPHPSRDSKA